MTPWAEARQAPPSTGFSRQEYWSRLPFPSPGDLPDPGIELESLESFALAGGFFTSSAIWEAQSSQQSREIDCCFHFINEETEGKLTINALFITHLSEIRDTFRKG